MKHILAILLLAALASPCIGQSDALLFARARGYAENGDFEHAAENWRALISRHADSQLAQVGLAQVLRRGEDFKSAQVALFAATRLGDSTPQLLWQRGLLLSLLGQSEEALRAFDGIRTADDQPTYHYQRGVALQALDRNDEACAAFARAGELDAEFFAARYAHFLCLRQSDDAAADALLPEIEDLRARLPEWVRNDQLRLEAGPLSAIEWPDVYRGLTEKLGGHRVQIELEGVRNRADGMGAVVEVWIGEQVLRRKVESLPFEIGVGDAKRLDIVRVEWPNGIVQNQFDVAVGDQPIRIREQLFIKGSWGGVQARED